MNLKKTKNTAVVFYDLSCRDKRLKEIRAYAKEHDLKLVLDYPFFPDALAEAVALKSDNIHEPVGLIGFLQDIRTPVTDEKDKTSQHALLTTIHPGRHRELQEAFRYMAKTSDIVLHALDIKEFFSAPENEQTSSHAISHFCTDLEVFRGIQPFHNRRRGADEGRSTVLRGRPFYGYTVENDKIVVNEHQAEAIRFIFKEHAKGLSTAKIIEQLEQKFPNKSPDSKKEQAWARYKISRILRYVERYKTGQFINEETGMQVSRPDLIILTKEFLKCAT